MNVQALATASCLRHVHMTAGFCPSSRDRLVRVVFWAVVNFGTIAPVMT